MSEKTYWKTEEQLENTDLFKELSDKEFLEELPVDKFIGDNEIISNSNITRRDFLKYLGFSTAVVTLASCKGKVNKVIPYVVKPENITPGEAEYFASTIDNGEDFASILIKTRDGRPIKIEPNKESKYNFVNARLQASILSLYDNNRLQNPKFKNNESNWNDLDKEIITNLKNISTKKKEIVILSKSVNSPSLLNIIKDFNTKYNNVSFLEYDPFINISMIDAYEELTGKRALPSYNLSKAKNIISIGADFLGSFYNGFLRKGYSDSRNPDQKEMSKHVQIESLMTISGANADQRISIKPSEQKKVLLKLISLITGNDNISKGNTSIDDKLDIIASDIRAKISESVILCDIDDKDVQKLVMEFNNHLNNDIFDINKPIYINKGNNNKLSDLITRAKEGRIGAIIINDINIVYNSSLYKEFIDCLKNINLKIQLTQIEDETSEYFDYVLPLNNHLESWGDHNPVDGFYTLSQPVIQKIFNTKQFSEIILTWAEKNQNYYEYLRNYWTTNISNTWNKDLHDGFFENNKQYDLKINFEGIDKLSSKIILDEHEKGLELILYKKEGIGNGNCANNPWLQEFPDPITRTTWDNYITINKSQAKELNLKNWHESNGALSGDLVDITLDNIKLEKIPVLIQPGQAYNSIGLSVGYGRNSKSIKKEMKVGVNAYPLYIGNNKTQAGLKIEKVEGSHTFACIQLHNTMMGRNIVKETTFDVFKNEPKEKWNPEEKLITHKGKEKLTKIDLWKEVDRTTGHHFNLSIDLNSCIGCGSCVISCQIENNIPVVGKEEVSRSRDMHWIRIDRYYSSDTNKDNMNLGVIERFSKMEDPSENPEVVFQPVMCQHCNHAPCETVCPVSATSHGKEGQNQMAYNRCVGTRYCANNCPYKVRRFNWFKYYDNNKFDYTMNDDLYRMVLNPDVVVRERGVMEKCSMCIQITQAGKLKAKKEGRNINDEDIKVACASSCPTDAIKFGDINDNESIIYKELNDDRRYYLLESVGTKPNVFYKTKIRNKKTANLM